MREENGIGGTTCMIRELIKEQLTDSQLLNLVACSAGLAADFKLLRVAVSDTETVARALDPQSLFAALVWVQRRGTVARVVALTVTRPERQPPHSLRIETLHGERVIVEELGYNCAVPESGYHLVRPTPESSDRFAWVPPAPPDDCPDTVERVWLRRGRAFQLAGAYATLGRQRVRSGLVREYRSGVVFDGELVRVMDNATWWWTGGPPKFEYGQDPQVPVTAQASSAFERVYRFDGLTFEEASQAIPEPARQPPHERSRTFRHETIAACAPPRSTPEKAE